MRKTICAIAAAALLAGCGGDSTTTVVQEAPAPGDRPPAEPKVDPADFVAAADAICADFNKRLPELSKLPTDEFLKESAESTDELRALEPPPELETTWNQYIAALEDQDAALAAGDARENRAADNRKEIAGRQLGFAECGTG